jgi:PAS domain S-box-containing protein
MMTDVPRRRTPRIEDGPEKTWLPMRAHRRRSVSPQRLTEGEALKALGASDGRLRLVLEIARLGTWDHDLKTGITRYSEAAAPMFGRPREGFWLSPDALMAYIHPGDRVAVAEAIRATLERGAPYLVRCRIVGDDGIVRWVESRAVLELDSQGFAERVSGVALDVTEQVEAHRALKETKESLESAVERRTAELTRANRDLSEFAYSVAHDLRAPLRAIVSTSSILLEDEGERLTQEGRDALGRQASNAIRLAKIVDDLLSFAKLAEALPKKESFDMTSLVRWVAGGVTSCRETFCTIEVQRGMRAFGDSNLIGYVVTNLLDNACKFSPEGGAVSVGEEDGAFFVRDEGMGFDMAHAHKLFIAFERLVGQEIEGTGVGLANVKRIVEKHGGRVWAESEIGKGATFWFTLW